MFSYFLLLQLHLQAVVSVIIATFVGFGVAMCGCSILYEISRWREIWRSRSSTQPTVVDGVPAQTSETASVTQATPNEPETLASSPDSPHRA